jgi:NAD(P)-dependent dehydrogenase (short-subunit alcohol dehydrogenase family)
VRVPVQTVAGKVVLVTGGSSGIGRGVAAELCKLGATVVITARETGRATAAAAAIQQDCEESEKEREESEKRERKYGCVGSCGVAASAGEKCGIVEGMVLELNDFANVRTFAAEFLVRHGVRCRTSFTLKDDVDFGSHDSFNTPSNINHELRHRHTDVDIGSHDSWLQPT